MDKIEVNLEVVSRLAGKTKTEVLELLKNETSESGFLEGEALQSKFENLVGEKFKSISDQQRGRAKREVLTDFEKQIRQNFGVENKDLQGLDLVNHLIDGAKTTTNELTPEAIKSHPFFREAMKAKNEELQNVANEFQGFKVSQEKQKTRGEVERKARALLLGLNPVLSKNEATKANQIKLFMSSIDGNFQVDGDEIKVLNDKGEELLNNSYNPVTFDSFLKTKAVNFFDFHEVDPNKKSPDTKTKHTLPTDNKSYSFPTFANMEEAYKYLGELKKEDLKKALAFASNMTNFINKK